MWDEALGTGLGTGTASGARGTPHGWDTEPDPGEGNGGDTEEVEGTPRGHSHAQRGLDAVIHQQLGQHGLQILLGALPARTPGMGISTTPNHPVPLSPVSLCPPVTHVVSSSHTATSRVSSMIPMASKVMVSSACSQRGHRAAQGGPSTP